ncbi:MAG: carbohydrate kinase family protein [Promethearchaeia archaeon]
MKPNLITIGSCTLDCLINIKDTLRFEMFEEDRSKKYTAIEYSKKLNIKNLKFIPGGSAANIASDCAMLGLKSAYIGKIGKDFSAQMCIDDLESRNVDLSHMKQTDKKKTAFSVILKSGWGKDRSILAYKGANDLVTPEEIDEDFFSKIKYFAWTSLTKENSCKAVDKCIDLTKNAGGIVFAAPSMSIIKNNPKWAEKLILRSDVISLNREEAEALTKKRSKVDMIKYFIDHDVDLISITDGDDGAVVSDGKTIINNSVYEIKIKDTTGSGDAFMGGIIISKHHGFSLEKTCKFASAIAALEASEFGVREGIPSDFDIIDNFIENHNLKQIKANFQKK